MISGDYGSNSVGRSVEVYVPSTGRHCQLADLPDRRWSHSMDAKTLCGGENSETQTSCLSLTDDGVWERTTTLLERR